MQVWELASGRCVNTLDPIAGGVGGDGASGCLQWTADGTRLGVAFATSCVGAWDPFGSTATAQSQTSAASGMSRPPAWCWSPDGGRVYVGGWGPSVVPGVFVGLEEGEREGRFRRYHDPKPAPMSNKLLKAITTKLAGATLEPRTRVAWSPDGERVVGHSHTHAWVSDGKGQVHWLEPITLPAAWSRDARTLVECSAGLTFRDGSTGAVAHQHPTITDVAALSIGVRGAVQRVAAVVRSRDGSSVGPGVTIVDEGVVRYRVETSPAPVSDGDFHVWQWSPDGAMGACLTRAGEVEVWSLDASPVRVRAFTAPKNTRGILWGDGVIVAIGPTSLRFVRASDGAVLGDHTLLLHAEGLRPLEDEKGDRGDDLRPERTFALVHDGIPQWITAFSNGLVLADGVSPEGLDGALAWTVHRRVAWPLRWATWALVPNAQVGATHPRAPTEVSLKSLRPHDAVRAGWTLPEGVALDAVFAAVRREIEHATWQAKYYATGWMRGVARLVLERGDMAALPDALGQIYQTEPHGAMVAEAIATLAHAGRTADAETVAKLFEPFKFWLKIDDVTLVDVCASVAAMHFATGDEVLGRAWMNRAEKAIGWANPTWNERLAACRALIVCGRDDEARSWWAQKHWSPELPEGQKLTSFVGFLVRTGRSALARELLACFAQADRSVAVECAREAIALAVDYGQPDALDGISADFGIKVKAADRTRARRNDKDRARTATASDRDALLAAHAALMQHDRHRRVGEIQQLALDAARRRHFGAVVELIDALPHRKDSLEPRVGTAIRALWIAATGASIEP